jgi:hypothetical protein
VVQEPTFVVPDEAPLESAEQFRANARSMWAAFAMIISDHELQPPDIRIVAAEDVWAASASGSSLLGLGNDHRGGPERLGGMTVAGKSLMSADDSRASVVIPAAATSPADGLNRLLTMGVLAHEMCHVLFNTLRHPHIPEVPATQLPWRMAELMVSNAADEFRADCLSFVVIDRLFSATDDDGNRVPIASLVRDPTHHDLFPALDEVVPALARRVQHYRVTGDDLIGMWNSIVETCDQVLTALAHFEAASEPGRGPAEVLSHPAPELLAPVWEPFVEHVRGSPLLIAPQEMLADRQALWEIGSFGFPRIWIELGVQPRRTDQTALDESFYIDVSSPGQRWLGMPQ